MDAFTRLELQTLLGELLIGSRPVPEIERDFRRIMADEKLRSYELGLRDCRQFWKDR